MHMIHHVAGPEEVVQPHHTGNPLHGTIQPLQIVVGLDPEAASVNFGTTLPYQYSLHLAGQLWLSCRDVGTL